MEFVKRYAYIFLGVLCVLALGGLFMLGRGRPAGVVDTGQPLHGPAEAGAQAPPDTVPDTEDTGPSQTDTEPTPPPGPAMIAVHIVGAVRYPDVYDVPEGSLIRDVLALAGGATEDADLGLINLAVRVQDAMQIRIPVVGDDPQELIIIGQPGFAGGNGAQGQQGQTGQTPGDGRININLASFAELQTLPGIGDVRARNIISFREANNGFGSIFELLEVSQIGDGTFAGIRDYVTVD